MARILGGATLSLALASCQSFNLFTPTQDVELGAQYFTQLQQEEQVVESGPEAEMVRRVMERLVEAAAVEDPELVEAFAWEVELFRGDETVNAFCLPGGKMGVYTGILGPAQGENGLAVVMGHEIAHAIERHGTERMTRQMGAEAVLSIAEGYVGSDYGNPELWAQGYQLLVGLPFGRSDELEADRVGLRYMARAGYDPREAVGFWQRMAALGGESPPEFLSTHPSGDTRIEQLQELMPDAIAIYNESSGKPKQVDPSVLNR